MGLAERSLGESLKAGIGGEKTDQSMRAEGSTRPYWLTKPLPLRQVNRNVPRNTKGPADPLSAYCVAVISRHSHELRPNDLRALPPELSRKVIARVLADRGYQPGQPNSKARPDEATMWGFAAVSDPEGAAEWMPTHTVALPTLATLQHLPRSTTRDDDRDHPLNALPAMFYASPMPQYAFLTTLSLDGRDESVNDTSLQALRWCTHLTVLWMRDVPGFTDDGVRMLASSITLPGDNEDDGRGMWRLRAWYLSGCRKVTDRSMKSFVRWPGLSVLDIRDTSCTESGMDIFNRANQTYFGGLQPPLNKCTEGLRRLFTLYDPPEDVLERLTMSLLKPDLPASEGSERKHLSLHVVPTRATPLEEWLHDPPSRSSYWIGVANKRPTGKYIPGVGTVYGKSRDMYELAAQDGTMEKRRKVEWALHFQNYEDECDRAAAQGRAIPMSWWEKEREEEKAREKRERERQKAQGYGYGRGAWSGTRTTQHIVSRAFKDPSVELEEELRARIFTTGKPATEGATERICGWREAMLVRMVHPQWKRLQPARAGATAQNTGPSLLKRAKVSADIAELLAFAGQPQSSKLASTPQPGLSSSSPGHSPPSDRIATPPQCTPGSQERRAHSPPKRPLFARTAPASQAPPSQSSQAVRRNPFAPRPAARTPSGVRGRGSTPKKFTPAPATQDVDPLAFLDRRRAPEIVDDEEQVMSSPLQQADTMSKGREVEPLDLIESQVPATPAKLRDPLAFVGRQSSSAAPKPSQITKPIQAPKPVVAQKRKATGTPTPAPKRTLNDFFARK